MKLRRQTGSAVVEITLLTPLLLLILFLGIAAGRLTETRSDVSAAAGDAARAASLRQAPAHAAHDARRTAERSLARRGVTCRRLGVGIDTSAFRAGGTVRVRVTCSVDLRGLGLLGLPGTRSVSADAVEVVDRYREG